MKKTFTDEHRRNISAAMKGRAGRRRDENSNWKGDDVSYLGLHTWIRRNLGQPSLCAHCGTTQAACFDWANVSGEYRRDRDDWIRLCRSCHMKFDFKNGMRKEEKIEFNGESRTLQEWAEHLGMKYSTLYARLKTYKMPIDEAFSLPVSRSARVRGDANKEVAHGR